METILATLETFPARLDGALQALYEDQDWATYLAIYHPEACVTIGTRIVPRNQLSAELFESWFEEAFMLAQPDRPPCRFAIAGGRVVKARDDEAHVLLEIQETGSDWSGEAHAWVRNSEDGWVLGGACFVGAEQPMPTLRTLPVYFAVELGLLEGTLEPGVLLLTPMDASFRRIQNRKTECFLALDEARFTCQNSGHCCSGSLAVGLAEREGTALLNHPVGRTDARIPEGTLVRGQDGHAWQVAADGDRCGFHHDASCVLHATVGIAPVTTCATYPLGFTRTPGGVRVWSSFTCPTVRSNIGERLEERQTDLGDRFRLVRDGCELVPDDVPWQPDGPSCTYSDLLKWEASWLTELGQDDVPIQARLDRVVRFLHDPDRIQPAVQDLRPIVPDVNREADTGITPLPVSVDRMMSCFLVGRFLKDRIPAESTWSGEVTDPLDNHWNLEGIEVASGKDLVTRYLRQWLFRQQHLDQLGVVGHVHRMIWIGRAVERVARFLAAVGGRPFTTEEDWAAAVDASERGFLHKTAFLDGLWRNASVQRWLVSPDAVL